MAPNPVTLFILRFPKRETVNKQRILLGFVFRIVVHPDHGADVIKGETIEVAVRQSTWQNSDRTLLVTGVLRKPVHVFPAGTKVEVEYTWEGDANGNIARIGGYLPDDLRIPEDENPQAA